ncbi:hypothetical protein CDAR_109371 [Caerostris darwini]|uniref:Uncharacterized protein n=1 Tax=Caerostris darwini TaxID=1538125 RepID=A0AAV4TSX4_9ARAC|nr:hypothetical protein CDAR_109371 [Caerostris darwini]
MGGLEVFFGGVVRAQLRYHYAIGGVYPIPHPDPSIWRGRAGVILVTFSGGIHIRFFTAHCFQHSPLHPPLSTSHGADKTKRGGRTCHASPPHPSFEKKISEGADLTKLSFLNEIKEASAHTRSSVAIIVAVCTTVYYYDPNWTATTSREIYSRVNSSSS